MVSDRKVFAQFYEIVQNDEDTKFLFFPRQVVCVLGESVDTCTKFREKKSKSLKLIPCGKSALKMAF